MTMMRRSRNILTNRDEAVLRDLYFTRILSQEQVAARFWPEARSVYFPASDPARTARGGKRYPMPRVPSPQSAERRLRSLVAHNHLVPPREHDGVLLYLLSKSAFRREAEDLYRDDERYRTWPKSRIPHYLDTNDVYIALAGELDAILGGPYPNWEWRDEARAHIEYKYAGEHHKHQPDAEIHFAEQVFFVERQTRRSREPRPTFDDKMAGYATHIDYLNMDGRAQVLFACDTERDMNHAREAADAYGVPTFVGDVAEVVDHVSQAALSLD